MSDASDEELHMGLAMSAIEQEEGKHRRRGDVECSTNGCNRLAWNGKPGETCCRTCQASDGQTHGFECEKRFTARPHEGKTEECAIAGCTRPSWNGKLGQTCCRTCQSSDGCTHGSECEARFHAKTSFGYATTAGGETESDQPERGGAMLSQRVLRSTKKWKVLAGEPVTYSQMCERLSAERLDPDELLARWLRLQDVGDPDESVHELKPLRVDPDTLNRAPAASELFRENPSAQMPCAKGCGRKAFGTWETCCPRCIGSDTGPHSRDCADKQMVHSTGNDFEWIRKLNQSEHRQARIELATETEEAVRAGGYVIGDSSIRFRYIDRMLHGTQLVSPTYCPETMLLNPTCRAEARDCRISKFDGVVLEAVAHLKRQGRSVVAINAAAAYHVGGGFDTGGRHALEEAMNVQTTLHCSLKKAADIAKRKGVKVPSWAWHQRVPMDHFECHIPDDGAVLSPFVELFRGGTDEGYPFQHEVGVVEAVVSVAMPNRNEDVRDAPVDARGLQKFPRDVEIHHPIDSHPEQYVEQLERKWRATFTAAVHAQHLYDLKSCTLVAPIAGCGVFKNPPGEVGKVMGTVLRQDFAFAFEEVVVALPGEYAGTNQDFFEAVEVAFSTR